MTIFKKLIHLRTENPSHLYTHQISNIVSSKRHVLMLLQTVFTVKIIHALISVGWCNVNWRSSTNIWSTVLKSYSVIPQNTATDWETLHFTRKYHECIFEPYILKQGKRWHQISFYNCSIILNPEWVSHQVFLNTLYGQVPPPIKLWIMQCSG